MAYSLEKVTIYKKGNTGTNKYKSKKGDRAPTTDVMLRQVHVSHGGQQWLVPLPPRSVSRSLCQELQ